MPKRNRDPRHSKRLVIDADVARSSGDENAVHPSAKNCHACLRAVLEVCHRFVLTDKIRAQWRRHRSKYAAKWQYLMYARKKVVEIPESIDAPLKERLAAVLTSENDKILADDDLHLIQAALATDRIVLSRDITARRIFAHSAGAIPSLASIAWVNPDSRKIDVQAWLCAGAAIAPELTLGHADS